MVRQVKIISDGTHFGTKVIDSETGNPIPYVQKVEFAIGIDGPSKMVITVCKPMAEIETRAEIVKET